MTKLKSWGLLDEVRASGCPPIRGLLVDLGDFPLLGHASVRDGSVEGYAPRRRVLDNERR